MKRGLFLCFFLLSGIILGALLANVAAGIPALSWLAFAKSISFHPVVDLSVISLDLSCTMGISVAQIITISLALFLYRRFIY